MNTTPDDTTLLNATRQVVARRTAIPPTPRDTLAVLRAAAEVRQEERSASFWPAWLRPQAAMTLAAAALAAAVLFWPGGPAPEVPIATAALPSELGLDLADWDVEFDALFSRLDQTLAALVTDDAELNDWMEDI